MKRPRDPVGCRRRRAMSGIGGLLATLTYYHFNERLTVLSLFFFFFPFLVSLSSPQFQKVTLLHFVTSPRIISLIHPLVLLLFNTLLLASKYCCPCNTRIYLYTPALGSSSHALSLELYISTNQTSAFFFPSALGFLSQSALFFSFSLIYTKSPLAQSHHAR